MNEHEFFALVFLSMVVGGVVCLVFVIWQRGRMRELAHRERLAMIERGIAPPPEVDPGRFERALGQRPWDAEVAARAARYRRSGVLAMGLGAGLFLIITFAGGAPEIGFGVGASVAVLGVALYANSHLELRHLPPPRTNTDKTATDSHG